MSAETKWTPGGWGVGAGAHANSYRYEIETATARGRRIVVARIPTPKGSPVEATANATLIAAAPTLYLALEETEAALELGNCYCAIPDAPPNAPDHGFVCSRCRALALARSALARARGEKTP